MENSEYLNVMYIHSNAYYDNDICKNKYTVGAPLVGYSYIDLFEYS